MLDPGLRLRRAVVEGNLDNVKRLLHRFPDLWLNPNPQHQGWTNLHYASFHGHYLVVFYLVSFVTRSHGTLADHFSRLDLVSFDGVSPLHVSTINHHLQVLNYLLQEFSDPRWVNMAGGEHQRTPLHYCCVHGFAQGMRLLLEWGADYSARDGHGDSVLHLCFQYERDDCVEVLLRFIARTLPEGEQALKYVEQMRNHRGVVATEYLPTFESGQHYEKMKHDTFRQRALDGYSQSKSRSTLSIAEPIAPPPAVTGAAPHTPQSSPTENRVLLSPIISVSKQKRTNSTTRAHSSSLPSGDRGTDRHDRDSRPPNLRKRSSTVTAVRPGNASVVSAATSASNGASRSSSIVGSSVAPSIVTTSSGASTEPPGVQMAQLAQMVPGGQMAPAPTFAKPPPSLKSITISPSVRKSSGDTGLDSASPQSYISESPATMMSPRRRLSGGQPRPPPDAFGFLSQLTFEKPIPEAAVTAAQNAVVQSMSPPRRKVSGTPLSSVRIHNSSSRTSLYGDAAPPAPSASSGSGSAKPRQRSTSNDSLRSAFGLRKSKSSGNIGNRPSLRKTKTAVPPLPEDDSNNFKGISFKRVRSQK
ncbi:hypothetical protein DIURU_000371 [Diutina rugosa]|uniref:Uncharacterized protein n=1 Tax=Diutina rugosa TaxID=5481 RepID=A0A642UYW0_DIURU|nr:uncharacterized protein DIURU_000371 [Diutina rugosa]KAA8907961.1 hypothetical protein DIURU_000371 [Diutina rugosa]